MLRELRYLDDVHAAKLRANSPATKHNKKHEASKRHLPQVLGLLPPTDAEGLTRWMTRRMGESRTDAQAKLALVRNQALFGRLQANKVPALLYRAADGRVILRAGLSSLAPAAPAR